MKHQSNKNLTQQNKGFADIIIIGIVLLFIAGGLAWYFLLDKPTPKFGSPYNTSTSSQSTTTSSDSVDDLDAEVKGISIEGIDSDFKDIDADIKGL